MALVLRIIAVVFARMKALGWLAQWAPAVAWVVEKVYDGDLKKDVYSAIAKEAADRAGLVLDENDPISDASFSGAVSQKLGFPVRTLKNRQMIIEDLDSFAADMVSQRSGYTVRSVSNVDMLKQDLERVALAVVSEKIGIPLGQIADDGFQIDTEAIKGRVLEWAKAQLLTKVNEQISIEVLDLAQGNVDWLVGSINERAAAGNVAGTVDAYGVSLMIADRLAVGAVKSYQQAAVGMTKRQRRQELQRAAQAKFRRTHGNRQVYVPLGMAAQIE